MNYLENYVGLFVTVVSDEIEVEGILMAYDKEYYHISTNGGSTANILIKINESLLECPDFDENEENSFYDEIEKLTAEGRILTLVSDIEQ